MKGRTTTIKPLHRLAWLAMLLMLGGCASMTGMSPHGTIYQRGEASYYAASFAGRHTANGERFDPAALTAAHRRLPMGSRVRVTNQTNQRQVIVRINDRGPYAHGRIIDLSPAAARRLHMTGTGIAPVTLQIVSEP